MKRPPKNKIEENVKDENPRAVDERDRSSSRENSTEGAWQKDIEKHDYYYDDSHGYEIYNPEDEDEETDED